MADSMDSMNVELEPQQLYYNYAIPLPPTTGTTSVVGDTSIVVTNINGASGPVITLAVSVDGLSFNTSGNTITLSGAVQQVDADGDILTFGPINDNEFLVRSGTDIISSPAVTPPLDVTTITFADTPYSLTDANDVILVDASGGATDVDLPNGTTAFQKVYYIKKIDASANAVNVNANGAQTIDGSGTQTTTTQFDTFAIVPDNVTGDWSIV